PSELLNVARRLARPDRSRRFSAGPDRQDADGGGDEDRYRPVPSVPQAGGAESRRIDQGPHRPVDDRGGRGGGVSETRRNHRRGDGRQYGSGADAGGSGQGL